MENIGTFKIAEPCHENWNRMTPEAKGRFCSACQRCVIDFAGKTQQEIKQAYDAAGGDVCGRVQASQLQSVRPAIRGKVRLIRGLKSIQLFGLALIAAFAFLFFSPAQAQKDVIMGKMAYIPPSTELNGRVTWDSGTPAVGVSIELRADDFTYATAVTDEKGRYQLDPHRDGNYELVANDGTSSRTVAMVQLRRNQHVKQDFRLQDHMMLGQMIYIPADTLPIEKVVKIEPVEESPLPLQVDTLKAPDVAPAEPLAIAINPNESLEIAGFELKVFPNPARDLVTLLVEKAGAQALQISLLTIEGWPVYQAEWMPTMDAHPTLRLDQLPAGIYIVRLTSGTQQIERRLLKL